MAKKATKEQREVVYDPETEISPEELEALPLMRLNVKKAPGRKMVSLRLKEDVIDALKVAARKRGVPYQVLVQMWLQERLLKEADDGEQPKPLTRLRQLSHELQQVVEGLSRDR